MGSRDVNNAGQKLSWIPKIQGIVPIPKESTVSFNIQDIPISDGGQIEPNIKSTASQLILRIKSQVSLLTITEIDSYKSLTEYLQNCPSDSYSIRAMQVS